MKSGKHYSPNRKAALIDRILSSTAYVCEALDNMASDQRDALRDNVAKVIADPGASLESVLDVYRIEVPRFAALWRDLENAHQDSGRAAAIEHILVGNYGTKLR